VCHHGAVRPLAVLLLACLLAPVAAAAKKPPTNHTKAGLAAARRALLPAGAFPSTWTSTPADKTVPALVCSAAGVGFDPTGIVELGAAGSPHYKAGSAGPFAAESVYVYKTPTQASRLWKQLAGPAVVRCLVDSIAKGSTQDVTFSKTKRLPVAAPRVAGRVAAYRVSAQAATAGQAIVAYFDLVLVGRGASIAALSFSSFSEPPPVGIEALLARAAVSRLH
jgi:hypothetical protein